MDSTSTDMADSTLKEKTWFLGSDKGVRQRLEILLVDLQSGLW